MQRRRRHRTTCTCRIQTKLQKHAFERGRLLRKPCWPRRPENVHSTTTFNVSCRKHVQNTGNKLLFKGTPNIAVGIKARRPEHASIAFASRTSRSQSLNTNPMAPRARHPARVACSGRLLSRTQLSLLTSLAYSYKRRNSRQAAGLCTCHTGRQLLATSHWTRRRSCVSTRSLAPHGQFWARPNAVQVSKTARCDPDLSERPVQAGGLRGCNGQCSEPVVKKSLPCDFVP